MVADCSPIDVICRARSGLTGAVSGVVVGAFEHMCRAFADAGAAVLKAVANAFLTASSVDLSRAGIDRVLLVTTSIAMAIAVLLLMFQVVRTGVTMRGEHLAQGLVGVFKAGLATACVFSVAGLLLVVADELSAMIMDQTFGSTDAFSARFAKAVAIGSTGPTGPVLPAALLLIFGLIAVVVGAVLFGEMVFRHAAIVVIVAVSPIAAAGMITGSTAAWWRKLVTAGAQLIFLKPLIVLVFAIGFGVAGESDDTLGALAGLATLLLAAFAWPALARMCTWTAAHVAEAGGVTAVLGGMALTQAQRVPGRMMSMQANGSAFDSDRATMARNASAISAGLAPLGAGAAAAAGVGFAASAASHGPRGVGLMERPTSSEVPGPRMPAQDAYRPPPPPPPTEGENS